jgi:hypothetical protein
MPTIVAICPYCRVGGVKAPDTAIGASASCPKCNSSFTVMPSDGLPGWAKPPELPSAPTARNDPLPSSSPLVETRAAATMPDVTEPSPVLPAEEKPTSKSKPAPALVPTATPVSATSTPTGAPDLGLIFALVAVILVGPAVLTSQLPSGRIIGLVLAGLGLLGGLASLGAEGRARIAGIAAMGMHLVIVLVLLFLPGWLNLEPWQNDIPEEQLKGPVALEHGSGLSTPVSPGDWIDAGKSSWEFKDIRVTVRSAGVGPVELLGPSGAKRTTKEPYLQLAILVSNVGVEREIPLSGWAAGQGTEGLRVTDPNGKSLSPATFESGWAPERGRITPRATPGHSSVIKLVFTPPPPKTEYLRLYLSGSGIGTTDEIRFRLSAGPLPRTPGK